MLHVFAYVRMCDICTHRYRLRARWCLHDRYHAYAYVITVPRAFAKTKQKKCVYVCARARMLEKKLKMISNHACARAYMHSVRCMIYVHVHA
jgi:hypothetical protein